MSQTAAFIMPVKIKGNESELRFFRDAVESIKRQTDTDWIIIMVDDFTDDQKVYDVIDEMKADLKDKLHVIYSEKNEGAGKSRNKGVRYASNIGAPFILFNDSDDISDPKRLELVRKAFNDDSVNVVYTSFDVIDENDNVVPLDRINRSVREIIEGHGIDPVEGENAWIAIATKKNYTNLTSCTAVRTSLAVAEPFPQQPVSEDAHTWVRYGAHPGKFVFLREIKGHYRICSNVESRSRGINLDFYEKKFKADSAGFEEAVKLAERYGTMGGLNEDVIRLSFYVRLALSLLHGESEEFCKESMTIAMKISKDKALEAIDMLPCEAEDKTRMRAIAEMIEL